MELKNRILLAFNKFYGNFVKDIKVINDDLRNIVKANYKVIEKLSHEHINYYQTVMGDDLAKTVFLSKDELIPILNEKKLVKDISVDMLLKAIDNPKDLTVFWNYIYILTIFVLIHRQEDTEALFTAVINVISKIQQGESVAALIDDILDDDVSSLLKRLEPVPMEKNAPPLPSNNMICDLAKEISSEIDTSNINIDKPEDVLKLMDFSSSNNIVGDIIKKVSSKIHDKINTGELKQEDLFGEAMNMMNMMNKGGGGAGGAGGMADLMSGMFNNPMMSEMFKTMKKGKAVPRQDVMQKAAARDRLRAKLEQRKS
jgi:hypothetical protein